jgi:hypothetical protein
VADDVHPRINDFAGQCRENGGVRPHQQLLSMGFIRNRLDQRRRKIGIDLDGSGAGAAGLGNRDAQVGLGRDRLHPGYLARHPATRGVMSARVHKEFRTRHQRGKIDVGRDNLVKLRLTLEFHQ